MTKRSAITAWRVIYVLDQRTRDTLERIIGKSADDLKKMDLIEEKSFVEEKTGKNLIFSKKMDSRMTGRGNPLIIRRRISTMSDIDQMIARMK